MLLTVTTPIHEEHLRRLAERFARRRDVSDLAIAVTQPGPGFTWAFQGDRPYFIASTTKLFTTAIVMQLRNEGRLSLDDPIGVHLEDPIVTGLNVWEGADRSHEVTVRDLLSHTSGIADYFGQERPNGSSLFQEIVGGVDRGWTFEEALAIARSMPARFAPGTPGKASYSDTNYQLLGAIIERLEGVAYEEALVARVLDPLGLARTWLFTPATIDRYDAVAPMLHGSKPVRFPNAMASFGPDGGLVSTANEQITFLRAFMGGDLFPASYLDEMTRTWRRVFFPLEYGIGVMRFALPRIMSPFRRVPPMIGHSGASGTVLYFSPERDLFTAATVNQVKQHSLPYKLLARV